MTPQQRELLRKKLATKPTEVRLRFLKFADYIERKDKKWRRSPSAP